MDSYEGWDSRNVTGNVITGLEGDIWFNCEICQSGNWLKNEWIGSSYVYTRNRIWLIKTWIELMTYVIEASIFSGFHQSWGISGCKLCYLVDNSDWIARAFNHGKMSTISAAICASRIGFHSNLLSYKALCHVLLSPPVSEAGKNTSPEKTAISETAESEKWLDIL